MSSYVNCLGGRCPHMTFFIGGHMSVGGGKCPTLEISCSVELSMKQFYNLKVRL